VSKNFSAIIFWGALWGLTEATVGHMLHIMPVPLGWILWSPIAFYFLYKIYSVTNNKTSVLYAAGLASLIKLIDLVAPVRIDYVINPAISILLEGLVVYLALTVLSRYDIAKMTGFALINTCWRILYLIYVTLMPAFIRDISPVSGLEAFLRFFVIENIITSVIFGFYLFLLAQYRKNCGREFVSYSMGTALPVLILVITICIQIIL